jgi:hypothetical protein
MNTVMYRQGSNTITGAFFLKIAVGNPRGGRTAAILARLTSSCRGHDMDPQLYFMQLLMNFPSWPATTLTPGFPIAGNKLTLPGARLWKYPLSIPENCASLITHKITMRTKDFRVLQERLLPSFPGFATKGRLIFVSPVTHTLAFPTALSTNYDALVTNGKDNIVIAITGTSGDGIAVVDLTSLPEPRPLPYAAVAAIPAASSRMRKDDRSVAAPSPNERQNWNRTQLRAFPHVTNTSVFPHK